MTLQKPFINYYQMLGVSEDAATPVIQQALEQYRTGLEAQLGNPITMSAARDALNEIVPGIEYWLLSGPERRMEYDRQLADFNRKQSGAYEPANDEGLDDLLRVPFFFDPYNDFDTEIPASTLRAIAWKLDQEWPHTCQWLADTASETHSFVSYLKLVANRRRLAERIEAIIKEVWRPDAMCMPVNEGVERCIDILDPGNERPLVGIQNRTFDGKVLDAGSYIPDLPARSELILAHEGTRGCAFGTIESRTDWLTFEQGRSSIHFALMPQGTSAAIGPSEVKIPLHFTLQNLIHNADYSAYLVLRMENQARAVELPFHVLIHVSPQPPRVHFLPFPETLPSSGASFLPAALPVPIAAEKTNMGALAMLAPISSPTPLRAGIVRRGQPARARMQAINTGDEALIPLVARVTSSGAITQPTEFHHNDVITIIIDTSNKPYGQQYTVPLDIKYVTSGAGGPEQISVQGEILPTTWQSMLREKSSAERAGAGGLGAFIGLFVPGILALLTHVGAVWVALAFLLTPTLFAIVIHMMAARLLVHRQLAGDRDTSMEHLNRRLLYGIPIVAGLAVALLYTLLTDPTASFLVGGFVGLILGFALGFTLDKAETTKTPAP